MTEFVLKIKCVAECSTLLDRDVIQDAKSPDKDPRAYEIHNIRAVDASGAIWVNVKYRTDCSDYTTAPKKVNILEMV